MDEAERLLEEYSDALPWMADPKTGRDMRDLFYRKRASVLAAMRTALDRDDIIEECAKVVEMYDCTISRDYIRGAAAAIRAMKSKEIT
jgi:hypothetical protein